MWLTRPKETIYYKKLGSYFRMDTCGRLWRWLPQCTVEDRVLCAWEYKGKEPVKGKWRVRPWRKSEQVSKLEVLIVCGPSAVRE